MRVREVLMRAVQREISWIQAADILGISARNMRRWKVKFETAGLEGVYRSRPASRPWGSPWGFRSWAGVGHAFERATAYGRKRPAVVPS